MEGVLLCGDATGGRDIEEVAGVVVVGVCGGVGED